MKLIYFEGRARIEAARLMLELAGVPYEIEAVPLDAWIGQGAKERMQERTPFGQLPILEDGAFTLCQSMAINRYLARKLGFYGATIEEDARIDEVAETALELVMDIAMFHWDPRFHERRAEHRDATGKKLELLDGYFKRVRADAEHWVLPGRYTLGDVLAAFALESVMPLHPGLLDGFPALKHVMTAFFTSGRVREYVRSERRLRTFTVHLAKFGGKPEETHHWTD